MKIFLDLDGVMADFINASFDIHKMDRPKEKLKWNYFEEWGIDQEEFWRPINEKGAKFWQNLEKYDWFDEVLDFVMSRDSKFSICTSPTNHHSSYVGKVKWIQKHFPEGTLERSFLCRQKYKLAKNYDSVLIDDSEANTYKWSNFGGQPILFPGLCNNVVTDLPIKDFLKKSLSQEEEEYGPYGYR
jgi:5'(3')-deoxyribonucleotidase